ncbi:MAG: pyruvate dehydrogenase (acetyl-transferring), homodimeric type, partial [Acidimicrobiales bacterium]
MIFDGFSRQLPDIDPEETAEWVDSLDAVVETRGKVRGTFLLMKLLERALELQVGFPATVSTPYINTIAAEHEPWFPGDEHMERRIRAYIRWNAAVMVTRANTLSEGIGGHLSTYASSASLYEVGFNHFFRGKDDGQAGDQVYFQGHAAPGIYARAFIEGRLSEEQLDHFRQELGGRGLSSYPHPRLMPEFWEFPTVSMGLGPINAIYQARFNRYLHHRRIADTSRAKVWCFLGDGETDEPESLGALSLASREQLDNLIFVVNCNLQRLDGPVRGNGKDIQELEAVFRGAGWNVIKVIWGSRWDELLARDTDGVLLNTMNTTIDGAFQKYAVESGDYIRQHFFGPDPRLRAMVEHLSDDELRTLPRGGHDYRKLYAAYKAAVEHEDAPTVILAKTVKGWALGPEIEGRNATHQIKKMTKKQLAVLRDRLYLHDQIPEEALDADHPPYYRPPQGSPEYEYLHERRRALAGALPRRVVRAKPLGQPDPKVFSDFIGGSGKREVSTTMAFAVLLRNLLRDPAVGQRVVPIIPDEARTFGLDALFSEVKIYAPFGQRYEPVDAAMQLSYRESQQGQILEEGITEAGSMASFTAAGTAYATWAQPMIPFYIFYSMFGFQRTGDLVWAFGDQRGRGFMLGATAGRTTLNGEGLQHEDGHSHVQSSLIPNCISYDPTFAYEL